MPGRDQRVLLLGGAGLVGMQCARAIARQQPPRRIVIASLFREETVHAVETLRREFAEIEFAGYYGNLFVRGAPVPIEEDVPEILPRDYARVRENRKKVFDDLYGDFETAYAESTLCGLIARENPDAVVDTVNTATAISYQDLFSSSFVVSRGLEEAQESGQVSDAFAGDVESQLISAAIPQLILHTRLLHRALSRAGTRIYVKVGTTGTGGMGLNIPYTHGEDKPSPTLMAKTATAFAHTGLLFLMARTPDSPIIKEVKPAAMIGYRRIGYQPVRGTTYRPDGEGGFRIVSDTYKIYECREESLEGTLDNTPRFEGFPEVKDADGEAAVLTIPCVNTGENGTFTRGEFEAITALGQMEFVTPEEIAQLVSLELRGSNTGRDVITAVDSSILSPSYKGGLIRQVAIEELEKLELEKGVPSIAIGQLGPPQLAKYLYETYFLKQLYGTVEGVLGGETAQRTPDEISAAMSAHVLNSPLRHTVTSVGIPILLPDGKTILRGPALRIPVYNRKAHTFDLSAEQIDAYATKGWVDLRAGHMQWWLDQFAAMHRTVARRETKWSSERLNTRTYLSDEIRIGEVVAWIFNNVIEPAGHRIK